jgi:hypothetical protein
MSENISNVDFSISYDNTKRLDLFFAQYEATSDFYAELSFISDAIGSNEEFTLPNGTTIEPNTTGGMVVPLGSVNSSLLPIASEIKESSA